MQKEKQSRIFWTEDEYAAVLNEAKRVLDATGQVPTPDEAQRAVLPQNKWRPFGPGNNSAIAKFRLLFRERYGTANASPRGTPRDTRHPEREPGKATVMRFESTPVTKSDAARAATAVETAVQATPSTDAAFNALANALTDRLEDAAVDLFVSIIDRTLTHPAVIKSVHALVQSAFAKEVQTTLDKTAPWPERTILSRLPRVLVVGLRPQEQERATEQYGQTLALRFWDEKQQSKGMLKQLVHGSQDIVVLPARIGHAAMQLIKARAKRTPVYVNGYGSEAMARLEELAKAAIVDSATTTEEH
jgi:hypothetical protein